MLKLNKCEFGAKECTYLGHRVGRDGIKLEESIVLAIQRMEQPKTKKDIRTFLGMTGYYRRFIWKYATIAEPLTNLTRKGELDTVNWTVSTEQAFQTLKNKLTTATIMKNPHYSKTFVLQTDVSSWCRSSVESRR